MRARDLGVELGLGLPGPRNAITDVVGVRVGCVTLIDGEPGPLVAGAGPVRTGVAAIIPHEGEIAVEPLSPSSPSGTGMVCHDFKGGTGTASREVDLGGERFVLGALVQADQS